MNTKFVKKFVLGLALAIGFVVAPGLSNMSAVEAQYRYNSRESDKGFRDGLDRGRQDAKTNRVANPNNSEHFRNGNPEYRDGFRRGYFEAYRQYSPRGGYGRRY